MSISSNHSIRWQFYEQLAYLRWTAEFGRWIGAIGWTFYADQVRGKI